MTFREFLIGQDHGYVFNLLDYTYRPMHLHSPWFRFFYQWFITPAHRVDAWMSGWDYRFRMRYVDRWLKPGKPSVFDVWLPGLDSREVQ